VHLKVRSDVRVFDISHMDRFRIKGEDVVQMLNKLIPKRLGKTKDMHMLGPTAFLNEKGGFKDDIMLYKISDDHWLFSMKCYK